MKLSELMEGRIDYNPVIDSPSKKRSNIMTPAKRYADAIEDFAEDFKNAKKASKEDRRRILNSCISIMSTLRNL